MGRRRLGLGPACACLCLPLPRPVSQCGSSRALLHHRRGRPPRNDGVGLAQRALAHSSEWLQPDSAHKLRSLKHSSSLEPRWHGAGSTIAASGRVGASGGILHQRAGNQAQPSHIDKCALQSRLQLDAGTCDQLFRPGSARDFHASCSWLPDAGISSEGRGGGQQAALRDPEPKVLGPRW